MCECVCDGGVDEDVSQRVTCTILYELKRLIEIIASSMALW